MENDRSVIERQKRSARRSAKTLSTDAGDLGSSKRSSTKSATGIPDARTDRKKKARWKRGLVRRAANRTSKIENKNDVRIVVSNLHSLYNVQYPFKPGSRLQRAVSHSIL